MALGGKSKAKKSTNSDKRYVDVASVWENESKNGGTYLSASVNNPDPGSDYYKGNLIWFDAETNEYYKVKAMNIFEATKGPENLTHRLVINLNDDRQVELASDDAE